MELEAQVKIHPRHAPFQRAKQELENFLLELRKKHELTVSESLALLAEELHYGLHRCVRIERRQAEGEE